MMEGWYTRNMSSVERGIDLTPWFAAYFAAMALAYAQWTIMVAFGVIR